jgi:hypothetical protein
MTKRIIHPPKISKEIKTAAILGTKASVGSWIWVVAWKILISKPTARPIPRIGAATIKIVDIASLAMLRTNSGVTVFPSPIQDSRYGIRDTGYRIQDTGYRIQDTGYRIQDNTTAKISNKQCHGDVRDH